MYLLMAVIYFFPGLYLLRYAGAIKRIGPANPAAMEEALDRQASFWRFVGIMTATIVIIYVVAIGHPRRPCGNQRRDDRRLAAST